MGNPVIAVALSRGVDSLVSGYLLARKFKNVFGIHFQTGYEKKLAETKGIEEQLGFPVIRIDVSKTFEKKVVNYFIKTYLDGKTPNPCMICNKEIKFGLLMDTAKKMGADYLATGHYATVNNTITNPGQTGRCCLEKGKDPEKDQSYFLSLLSEDQLQDIIFPLAAMTKKQVRAFAKSKQLAPLHTDESQDICFIHEKNFSEFIIKKTLFKPEKGNIIDISGKIVGTHSGLHQFTIGQRRGINCPSTEPYYVKKIDMQNNILQVCYKKDLAQKSCSVEQLNWNSTRTDKVINIEAKIRYSHKGAGAALTIHGQTGFVEFDRPQNEITPGQGAVFYRKSRVLGAGIIQ